MAIFLFAAFKSFGQDYVYSESYQEYLRDEMEIKEFDRNQWEIIKRSIVDGVAEENYTIVEGDGEGDPFLTDKDNPFKRSKESYKEYLRKTKGYKPQRIPEADKSEEEKQKERARERERNSFSMPAGLGYVLGAIIVVIFAFVIYFLFFKAPVDPKSKNIEHDLENRKPTEIPKTELEILLEKATEKEDYREAIRIYFIFIIRGLIVKEWIEWEKEKTNFSYLVEMRDKSYFEEFESCMSVYEIVWYGERIPTKAEYKVLEPRFKNLVKNLDK